MSEAEAVDHEPWPLRAAILLCLGAVLGLAIHFLTRGAEPWQSTEDPLRLGAAAALAAGGIVFGFSLERPRWLWSVLFALGAGAVVGFVTYWNGQPESWGAGEGWQLVSALLAIVIAVPLFQASRDRGRWNLDYRSVHGHMLTNIALWFVAWGFVLLTYLLMLLLSELFQLIGIVVLRDWLQKDWVAWLLIGGALGAAIGLLRDRDRIVGTLQRVATAILSVLAPVLAAGLVIFVLALPFTGLGPLWEQTRSTTPILLVCILGAVILVNAVIGSEADDEESRPRIVRWAAAALAVVVLPLAIVAAVSTGKRIAQHGFTPDRLWAAVFVAITVAGAAAYLYAVVRGRAHWPALLRSLNLRIAIGICLVALFLALPIVGFGSISTRDQLARLESGRIAPNMFDWAALRYDFGPSGHRAVERLAGSSNPEIRGHAQAALAAKSRWDGRWDLENYVGAPKEMRVLPTAAPVPPDLREAVLGRPGLPGACTGKGECFLLWEPGQTRAVAIMDRCPSPTAVDSYQCDLSRTIIEGTNGRWVSSADQGLMATKGPDQMAAAQKRQREALRRGQVEIRDIPRRQLFVGGEPVGDLFE